MAAQPSTSYLGGNLNSNANIHIHTNAGQGQSKSTTAKIGEEDLSPIEKTFTSLIQQYLTLLLPTNATFLAERMVAYKSTPYSNYLLAMCHYRSHHPKRARSVLSQYSNYSGSMSDCILYLLAKCCVDLGKEGEGQSSQGSGPGNGGHGHGNGNGYWNEAEEYLLKNAKEDYAAYRKQVKKSRDKEESKTSNNAKEDKIHTTMDAWLASVIPSECPVPNGAAGYHLLGLVCKRTMRNEKAAKYFSLSLKLDPMMWSSYEELCEMGAASNGSKAEDGLTVDFSNDPASIFGVIPKALMGILPEQGGYANANVDDDKNKDQFMGGESKMDQDEYHSGTIGASPFSLSNSPILADGDMTMNMMGNMNMHDMSSRSHNVSGVAGRLSFGAGADMQTPGTGNNSELHGTSLFQNAGNISTIHSKQHGGGGGGGRRGSGLPSAALFASPIPVGTATTTPSNYNSHAKTRTGKNQNPHFVLARAREVAGRRYYEPSPETTPPNRIRTTAVPHSSLKKTKRKYRRRLIDSSSDRLGQLDESYDASMNFSRMGMNMGMGDVTSGGGGVGGNGGRLFDDSMEAFSPGITGGGDDVKDIHKSARKATTSATATSVTSASKLASVQEEMIPTKSANDNRGVSGSNNGGIVDGTGSNGNSNGNEDSQSGVQYILELLCTCGAAQRMLCAFKCKEALQILHTLPYSQFQTGWVQHQVGRAYFALVDYTNAQRALETMQQVEPHRMRGLELLSTTLWLLKKEVELSNLAQRVSDFDRLCPETWCVVGNCFSLQKEHKTALTFFRRSIQLDPTFTYAHTLSGHEYVANEDFDHAVASFRNAIRVDERHYNAWNGLGEIYFRQEKYDLAEYHFQKGLSINPQSSVIRCNLGQAQHANGKHEIALDTLKLVDKRNPQAQYQRANILISMDKLKEALRELEKVRDAAPREASVHFAMGRVLKRMKRTEDAMRAFLTALDLDPKENTLIKSAIDRLDEPDVNEDVSAF